MADDSYLQNMVNALKGVPLSEAMPFGAGTTPQGDPTALSSAIAGVMTLPKRAIDSAAEDQRHYETNGIDPSYERKAVGPAVETAMMGAGVGMPMAESGAAGMFGGRLARTADLRALNEAERMRMHGLHPDDVARDTGWVMSPADNKWRFEIPDNKSTLTTPYLMPGERVSGAVGNAIDHNPLFKAYPELTDKKFDLTRNSKSENLNIVPQGQPLINDNDTWANRVNKPSGMWSNNTASVIAPDQKQAHSVLLHELQHGVQDIEGFSPGANPNYYASKIEQGLRNKPGVAQGFDYNTIKNQAQQLYNNTAGEVEARNTQLRQFMTPEQRLQLLPRHTQQVPYGDQYHFDRNTEILHALRQK